MGNRELVAGHILLSRELRLQPVEARAEMLLRDGLEVDSHNDRLWNDQHAFTIGRGSLSKTTSSRFGRRFSWGSPLHPEEYRHPDGADCAGANLPRVLTPAIR